MNSLSATHDSDKDILERCERGEDVKYINKDINKDERSKSLDQKAEEGKND